MKLYYSPGACSLAPHIALREAQLPFELVRTSTKSHKLADGTDFYAINSKGYVPVLEMEPADGSQRLTEVPVVLQYIADRAPQFNLVPAWGSMERYRVMEWLNFVTSELHKGFAPLFKPTSTEDVKAAAREGLLGRLAWLDGQLADGRHFLAGETFTVADAYLFTVINWGQFVGIDLAQWPHVQAYAARVAARPAVQAALEAEGLLKK